MPGALLEFTEKGIFCPQADFYIDPWRPVDRALITHGHSDHARYGHGHYLCANEAAPVIRHRLGGITMDSLEYGETRTIAGVTVSFHPAGHIPGSAQVRLERKGEVWVVSGDYKLEDDGLSAPFEPIRCHSFITECTFGLPVFAWRPQAEVMREVNAWWQSNAAAGRVSVLAAYSLGKAQRLIANLDTSIGPILTHGAVENTNAVLRKQGIKLPQTTLVNPDTDRKAASGAIVIAPPAALGSAWVKRFGEVSTGVASGWMALRGVRRRRGVDRGFVISDHVDWADLNRAVKGSGAERIFVTHGYTATFCRWLRAKGYDAHVVDTEFEGETADAASGDADKNDNVSGAGAGQ